MMDEYWTESLVESEGFSLTELMVAVSLMLVVIAAAWLSINAVSNMSDSIFAHEQANRSGAVAVERLASDLREGGAPPAETPQVPFRQRTATTAEFYLYSPSTGRVTLIKYYTSADPSGGMYTLYRAQGATTSATPASSVTSGTSFAYSAAQVVAKGLVDGTIFSYYQGAVGLPAATVATPPAGVGVSIDTKGSSGKFTAVTTNQSFTQLRTMSVFSQ
jgi:prepilin-type N-terminal cleavage/methylation domain-containing protein